MYATCKLVVANVGAGVACSPRRRDYRCRGWVNRYIAPVADDVRGQGSYYWCDS